mgnify:CR=1 FL=1
MTILEKLYDGEIIPSETAVPGTEEYREKLQKKTRIMQSIREALPADRQELLTELKALCLSIAEDECRCTYAEADYRHFAHHRTAHYAEGVRFGIDLMVEIHGKDKTAPVILPRLDK